MVEQQGEGFNLEDRDRLPWLEPAEEEYVGDGVSPAKIIGLVALGLALLALIVGGGYWLKSRGNPGYDGEAKLIPAQKGSYKVPVSGNEGKSFEGEGDSAYATSEGAETAGRIDASKVPEAPLANVSRGSTTREEAAKPVAAPMAGKVVAKVKDQTKAAPEAASAGATGGGALIQLGAYGSTAVANDAWKKFAKRFDYLAPLGNSVQPVTVGGQTLYRLRAQAGSAAEAATLCGKLRVAGESCMVVN